MKTDRVIICQDYRTLTLNEVAELSEINAIEVDDSLRERIREDVNRDQPLISYLRGRGYEVHLFDGYDTNLVRKLRDPLDGAKHLGRLIDATESSGIVYDLSYFGDFSYGLEMLKRLIADGYLTKLSKLIVLSYFIDERPHNYREQLVALGVEPDFIKYALRCPFSEIDRLLAL